MPAREKDKLSTWSIGDFYHQAWDLTWNNKKLWILGLAVSIYGAGGGSGGGNSSFDANGFKNFSPPDQQQEQALPESPYLDLIDEAGAQVSVPQTEAELDLKVEQKSDWIADMFQPLIDGFNQVPGSVLALLVLEGMLAMVGFIILGLFLSTWATSALIQGVGQAANQQQIDLFKISSHAVGRVKSMVWLMFVPGLKFFLTVLLIGLALGVGVALVGSTIQNASPVLVLVGIGAVGWFFYALARLLVALIYASRYCVLENMAGSDAYAAGYALAKANLWKTIRLGLVNMIVASLIGLIIMLPLAGVGLVTVVRDILRETVSIWSFVPAGLTLLLTMPIMFLVGGIIKVFVYGTWHFAFTALKNLKADSV